MPQTTFIPTVKLDTSAMPGPERFDAWYDSHRYYMRVRTSPASLKSDNWSFSAWQLQDALLARFCTGPYVGRHGPREVRQTSTERLIIRLFQRGRRLYVFENTIAPADAGEVHIFYTGEPYTTVSPGPVDILAAFVPIAAVGYDPSVHPHHMSFSAASSIGRQLTTALTATCERAPTIALTDAGYWSNHLAGLIRGLVMPGLIDDEARAHVAINRELSMFEFVRSHLHDPLLGVEKICDAFACSRRTAFRSFSKHGGLSRYVYEQRLVAGFNLLVSEAPRHGAVSDISNRVGFRDPNHFSRQFRERFGITPSDAAKLGAVVEMPPPGYASERGQAGSKVSTKYLRLLGY